MLIADWNGQPFRKLRTGITARLIELRLLQPKCENEVGAAQVRVSQVRIDHVRMDQVRAIQVRAGEIRAEQVDFLKEDT